MLKNNHTAISLFSKTPINYNKFALQHIFWFLVTNINYMSQRNIRKIVEYDSQRA